MKDQLRGKETKNLAKFVDQLIHPPNLSPSRRRASSQRHHHQHQGSREQLVSARPYPPEHLRPKSEDKPSSIFTSTKNYVESTPLETSTIMLEHISELSDTAAINLMAVPHKGVKFRESLIQKNDHNRRENMPSDCRTPSILKRSRMLREKTYQNLQSNITGSETSRIERKSTLGNDDREARAVRNNQVVKKRYYTIIERFQAKLLSKARSGMRIRTDQKYKDQLFPPTLSSIYRATTARTAEARADSIRWMRLPELFKDSALCVLPQGPSNIEVYCNEWQKCKNFIGDVFTAIKDCRVLLENIFQVAAISDIGVYLVKIFQQNVWKYVIVDDYIPTVTDNEGNQVPMFLNICLVGPQSQSKPLELWPFLLEKAYANYYANYESLHFGDALDFLEQVSGAVSESFEFSRNIKTMAETMSRLGNYFNRQNIIMMGHIDQIQIQVPIYRNVSNVLVSKRSFQTQSEQVHISLETVFDYFDKVYVVSPGKWPYRSISTISINTKRIPGQFPRFDVSIRTLKVSQAGQVAISVRQKEKRFYQSSTLNYKYFWVRVLLLQKQFDGSCRWVNGHYSNNKTISISEYLEPGEYYIVVFPEWKCSHCYELSVLALATVPVSIQRKEYDDRQKIVERGCQDLAQRHGRLQQINIYACSYCVVQGNVGFMIENINNQRFNGDIRINRSIGNIRGKVEVAPFNIEFYQNKSSKVPFKNSISIRIPADQSYTVVLMTRGGVDRELLNRFDFAK